MNNKNEQKNIEAKVLDKISKENLKPKPKWEFLMKNIWFWILGVLTVILGGLSVSASLFVFKNIKWGFYNLTHNNIFTFTIEFIPYLWLLLLTIFIFFGYNLIRKTKHGYKYRIFIIASTTILSSIILGFIFTLIGFGQIIDKNIGNKIPFHKDVEMKNRMIWNNPKDGLLVGKIEKTGDKYFIISPNNTKTEIITNHLDDLEIFLLSQNREIKVIGLQKEEGFYICHILPDVMGEIKELKQKINFERKSDLERNKECEEVRPYKKLLD